MGRGTARLRVVRRLGGLGIRKARKNAADVHEGGGVFHVLGFVCCSSAGPWAES